MFDHTVEGGSRGPPDQRPVFVHTRVVNKRWNTRVEDAVLIWQASSLLKSRTEASEGMQVVNHLNAVRLNCHRRFTASWIEKVVKGVVTWKAHEHDASVFWSIMR